jgi:Outer membrane protein Omp28/Secretion system C-terminal sorting domain
MNKIITSVLAFSLLSAAIATAQAPKYVFFEHFTNTRCSVCGGANPAFYQNINITNNPKLHHITIHPSIPYSGCVFYQANTQPQDARASFYNLPGTPRVAINGGSTTGVSNVTTATIDAAYCATCSPIQVKVTEQDNGLGRAVSIQVKSIGAPSSGNYKLFAAIVEKTVNYSAPNSESVHRNVFRQFLTATAGDAVTLAAQGGETTVNFNYTLNQNWVASEAYIVAWLYDATSNTIVNSGTKFDAQVIPVELSSWKGQVKAEKNSLEWTTQSEINSDYFDIERSINGKQFTSIGRIKAAGNSASLQKYTFDDEKPAAPINYYRLKTVDLDGSTSFSNTLTLAQNDKTLKKLTLSPSLTSNTLNISYFSDNANPEIRILDGLGKVVYAASKPPKAQNTEGSQSEVLDVSHLSAGVYFVQLIQNNTTTTARFVKTN